MVIKLDDVVVFELAQWEQDVIKNEINSDVFVEDVKRRLEWVLRHKVDECFKRFEAEWLQKLRDDPEVQSIPATKQGLVEAVLARPDYQDRKARDGA